MSCPVMPPHSNYHPALPRLASPCFASCCVAAPPSPHHAAGLAQRELQEDDLNRLFIRFQRCDGHMFHITASLSLTRACVTSALFSAAVMLRCGSYKWRMRAVLRHIIDSELVWHQGGSQRPEDRVYAELVLRKTVLRNFPDRPVAGSKRERIFNDLTQMTTELLAAFNGDWREQRVSHRCCRLPDGSL